jgi:hypothetical protein
MACHDQDVIYDSTIRETQKNKKNKKNYMMMWNVIPHHINLGPRIPMSLFFN